MEATEPIKDRAYWLGEYGKAVADREGMKQRMAQQLGIGMSTIEEEGFIESHVNSILISFRNYIDKNFPE